MIIYLNNESRITLKIKELKLLSKCNRIMMKNKTKNTMLVLKITNDITITKNILVY